MSYRVSLGNINKIVIVGCGGTGSLVADSLCRLLPNNDAPIYLVDMDRVERHNLHRQAFFESDLGKFKSQCLAERLSRQYGKNIAFSILPFDKDTSSDRGGNFESKLLVHALIIGCVDNAVARRSIAAVFRGGGSSTNWWLDAGNGMHSGQVLLGNISDPSFLEQAFNLKGNAVSKLPIPSLQLPSLLAPAPIKHRDCAEAVEADEQSPVINSAMAMLVTEFVYRILKNTLDFMGAYIDLEAGTLHYVQAEPVIIARMLSVKVDDLMVKEEEERARVRV